MRKLPKILFLFAAVLIVTGSCKKDQQVYFFTSFHEPADQGLRMLFSYDGYHWKDLDTILLKPAVGNQEVMRDPSITRGPDGVFHLVWTSSWQGDPGFGYASSKDLNCLQSTPRSTSPSGIPILKNMRPSSPCSHSSSILRDPGSTPL